MTTLQVRVIKRAEMSMRSLLQPDQIWYGGLVRAESAMRIMSDIGSKLTHTFQVTNDGPWPVEDLNVLIEWPHSLVNNKRLLYLAEAPEVTPPGIGECYVNPRHINSLGLRDAIRRPPLYVNRRPPRPYNDNTNKLVIQKRRRRKRSVPSGVNSDNYIMHKSYSETRSYSSSTYSVVSKWPLQQQQQPQNTIFEAGASADIHLDCSDSDLVQCHIFTCRIHGGLRANQSAVVRLRSRVWNSTLVEEFGDAASIIAIHAKAHLELPEELDLHQKLLVDDSVVATLMAFPDASVIGEGTGLETVPTWIIAVSVIVGLIVVSLIAGTLYKLGFFQRNRVPEDVMISGKMMTSNGGQNGHGGRGPTENDYIS